MNTKGKFIAFEGLDGSGASTQVDLLVDILNGSGHTAFSTKEPTNNLIGGLIRGALTKDWSASPECFQLLFAADRAHHLNRMIIPNLEKGNIIVSDRYFFSTFAFGSINLPIDWLREINRLFPVPDLTILLKVRPTVCLERISRTRIGKEFFEEEEKLEKTWKTYESLSRDPKNNIRIIDGEQSIEEISDQIYQIVKKEIL
ncbi:MAG: dTMP kinase [Patescibacteria group bacterium]